MSSFSSQCITIIIIIVIIIITIIIIIIIIIIIMLGMCKASLVPPKQSPNACCCAHVYAAVLLLACRPHVQSLHLLLITLHRPSLLLTVYACKSICNSSATTRFAVAANMCILHTAQSTLTHFRLKRVQSSCCCCTVLKCTGDVREKGSGAVGSSGSSLHGCKS